MKEQYLIPRLAGSVILLSFLVSFLIHPYFIFLVLLLAVNLLQYSFTKFCPATWILRKLGMKIN